MEAIRGIKNIYKKMQTEEGAAKPAPTFKEMLEQAPPHTVTSTNISGMYAVADYGIGNTTIAKVNRCPFCNCYWFDRDGTVYKLEL